MYTPSPYTPANRWRSFNALADTAQMFGERHYPLPEKGSRRTSRVEAGKGSRKTSRVEARVHRILSDEGFSVQRFARVSANVAPFTGIADISLSPDLLVGDSLIIELDTPARLGGGPSHTTGFPARDMVRMDFFRAAGFDTVAIRLWGLDPIPDHTCVMSDGGLTLDVVREVLAAAERASRPLRLF